MSVHQKNTMGHENSPRPTLKSNARCHSARGLILNYARNTRSKSSENMQSGGGGLTIAIWAAIKALRTH
jgi:hypothetical protein